MANQLGFAGEQEFIFNNQNLTKLYGWRVLTVDNPETSYTSGYSRTANVIRYNTTFVINSVEENNVQLTVSIVKQGATTSDVDNIISKLFQKKICSLRVRVVSGKNCYANGIFTSCEATQYADDITVLLLNFDTVEPYMHYTDSYEFVLNSSSKALNICVKDDIAKIYPGITIKPCSNGSYFSIENKSNGSKFYTGKLEANKTYKLDSELKQFYCVEDKKLIFNKNWVYLDSCPDNDHINQLNIYDQPN